VGDTSVPWDGGKGVPEGGCNGAAYLAAAGGGIGVDVSAPDGAVSFFEGACEGAAYLAAAGGGIGVDVSAPDGAVSFFEVCNALKPPNLFPLLLDFGGPEPPAAFLRDKRPRRRYAANAMARNATDPAAAAAMSVTFVSSTSGAEAAEFASSKRVCVVSASCSNVPALVASDDASVSRASAVSANAAASLASAVALVAAAVDAVAAVANVSTASTLTPGISANRQYGVHHDVRDVQHTRRRREITHRRVNQALARPRGAEKHGDVVQRGLRQTAS
jgi:hypothetical protein